jgi:hypothetical protein
MKSVLELSSQGFAIRFFGSVQAWVFLVCLILVAPLLIRDNAMIYATELLLGILFALYYPVLRRAIKGSRDSSWQARFGSEEECTQNYR